MTTLSPKAIVITAYSGTHDIIEMSRKPAEYSLLDTVDCDSDDSCNGAPKKRRRLTHLSPDEKLLRRKLKNRVAAQTARDRKKALMSELEERVAKLEEENKLLKRQNVSLKEASHSLIKENAELKSRLSEEPVTPVKTETDTSRYVRSTSCSSAEGTGTDSVSMCGSVSRFCDNTQSDDIFGLLQELSQDVKLEHSETQTASSSAQGICGGSRGGREEQSGVSPTATPVVGLSSAELESLNELIQIDHVYVKPQPSSASSRQGGKAALQQQQQQQIIMPVSPKQSANVATIVSRTGHSNAVLSSNFGGSKITCLPTPKLQEIKSGVLVSGLKRQHTGQLVVASQTPVAAAPTLSAAPQTDISQPEVPEVIDPESYLPIAADDFAGSLADPDMDSSLNFLTNFGMDFLVPQEQQLNFGLTSESNNSGDSSVPDPSFLKEEDLGCASPPASELNPIKLFDEIYEHYLNIKDPLKTDSPIPSVHSDSGIGSDIEPLSPLSSGESLNDDYLWQDLFPDLQ